MATPDTAPRRRRFTARRVVGWTCGGILFGVCLLIVLSAVGARSGITATVLGVVMSLVVLGIVVPVFRWLDRFEPEPFGMQLFAFLWGACVATLGAAVLNQIGSDVIGAAGDQNPVTAMFVAPPVEESLKALAPLILLVFRRKEIDGIVDGMVYAGLCAAGFAFVEDVIYLANGYADSGERGLVGTFLVRVVMSPFAHPMFTICTGIGVGIAATSRGFWLRTLPPLIGWVCAVLLHMGWNALAVLSQNGWLVTYVLVQVPLFCSFLALLWFARNRESAKIGSQLSAYVDQGWLSPAEVHMMASMPERRYARAWAKSHGGRPLQRQMVDLQDLGSELAMLRSRMSKGDIVDDSRAREQRMLETLWRLRQPFLGTPLYRGQRAPLPSAGRRWR